MPDLKEWLQYAGEVLKIIGAFASFYAVFKLRQIEKKYLFKATIPEVVANIQITLDTLNKFMLKPADRRVEISEALYVLATDVRNIKRKSRGDSLIAASQLLQSIELTRPGRYFWEAEMPMAPRLDALIEIYGKGMGLIRSLEHDLNDRGWSEK